MDSRLLHLTPAELAEHRAWRLTLYSQGSGRCRVQCAFVDTPEVTEVVKFISGQRKLPLRLSAEVAVGGEGGGDVAGVGALDPNDRDELFAEVAYRLVAEQRASTISIHSNYLP